MMKVVSSTMPKPARNRPHRIDCPTGRFDGPDDLRQRLPLPVENDQDQARCQHERAALYALGQERGQALLESRPGHDRVLYSEQRDQPQVDEHRGPRRHGDAVVDALGDHEVRDERDQVQERQEEDGVTGHAVCKADDASHVRYLRIRRASWVGNDRYARSQPHLHPAVQYARHFGRLRCGDCRWAAQRSPMRWTSSAYRGSPLSGA